MTPDPVRLARLKTLAQHYVDDGRFAGIAWRLTQSGHILNAGEVGWVDRERSTPIKLDTIYRIYSMTKPIVSLVALQLVEEGKLRLYDPVAAYIPAFKHATVLGADGRQEPVSRPIHIEDLLTHRAGLSYDFLPDCAVAKLYQEVNLAGDATRTLAEFNRVLASLPLARQPGTQWYYSYATDVLAHVLEVVTGQNLAELLKARIFDPLDMPDTAFSVANDALDRLMADPPPQVLKPMDVESGYPSRYTESFARGGHGLFSTIEDYSHFAHVLLDGKSADGDVLLSAPMVNMMWQNRIPAAQRPLSIGPNEIYGYGWNLFGRVMLDTGAAMQLTASDEGGWAGAASTHFWVDRHAQMTGIVMTQFLGSSIGLGAEMQSAAYQAFV